MFTVFLPKGILASFYLNTMAYRDGMWYVTGTYNGGIVRATMSCFMSPDDTPDGFGYCCVSSFEVEGEVTHCNKMCALY